MPMFKLPLSGDVNQAINPWSFAFNPVGGQFGLVNVTLGQSSAPAVEAEVLTDVAGYGKQLGRIGDALHVLVWTDAAAAVLHGQTPRFPEAERRYVLKRYRIVDIVHRNCRVGSLGTRVLRAR